MRPFPGNQFEEYFGKAHLEDFCFRNDDGTRESNRAPKAVPCTNDMVVTGKSKLRFQGNRSSTHISGMLLQLRRGHHSRSHCATAKGQPPRLKTPGTFDADRVIYGVTLAREGDYQRQLNDLVDKRIEALTVAVRRSLGEAPGIIAQ